MSLQPCCFDARTSQFSQRHNGYRIGSGQNYTAQQGGKPRKARWAVQADKNASGGNASGLYDERNCQQQLGSKIFQEYARPHVELRLEH